jgi:hypothetical protein
MSGKRIDLRPNRWRGLRFRSSFAALALCPFDDGIKP